MAKEALPDDLPYQSAAQVRQALAERAEAVALGQTTRVEAADKVLKALGWKAPERPAVRRDSAPEKRESPSERNVTAEKGASRPARKS